MSSLYTDVEVVGIVGAGVIGASWSALFLAAGREVDVYDPSPTAETDTRAYIERAWPSLEELGMVCASGSPERLRFVAEHRLPHGVDPDFIRPKIATARFYGDHLLSKAPGLRHSIVEGAAGLQAMPLAAY